MPKEHDLTIKGQSIEPLRRQIVRASSWRQLFPSRQAEMQDFIDHIVGAVKAEYESNHSLVGYWVEKSPKGAIHFLEHTDGGRFTTFQKLASGDVVINFNTADGLTHTDVVTPSVGNINHTYTIAQTILPDSSFFKRLDLDTFEDITGTSLYSVKIYRKGKPATQAWEDMMLFNSHVPQRIGHRVYPAFVLEAISNLQRAYPQEF
jgi:hypothetical protein